MIVAIHQPQYLPWIGFFDKIRKADAFCFLDNVQYKKNEWQNRNRIKTPQGWQWMTVPVRYKFPLKIRHVRINNAVDWRRKHLQAIMTHYRKTPFFEAYIDFFQNVYTIHWEFLSELNVYLIKGLCELLGIEKKQTLSASSMNLSEEPTDRLLDICASLNGDTYLSGQDGAKYMAVERFHEKRITLLFQEFQHPVYPQRYGSFQSHLSVVDLLFNCGTESLKIIQNGKSEYFSNRRPSG